ncbi:uncharacterized protein PGRI_035700 [Penicillium griseofulvum]|uniref:Uncharacterized protein n=1 Tax=Penicillium patulum TaxID=5078 RepID=A0A135LCX9_PENPA|nr:uncharacterized protein PGRI_035700 [Penicillium griseofulvum]KXG46824.1 hypothetical protein PGRI_035700 [Penicillium griseofulvum]
MADTLEELVLLEPLWDKAIQSPSSVTLDEKHRILGWPTRAIMQANAQKHLNLSVDDLFHKAATNPHSLTYPECLLMDNDFHILSLSDQFMFNKDRLRLSVERPDLTEKMNQARAIVFSPIEAKAFANLRDDNIFFAKSTAYHKALEENRKPLTMPREWVKNVLDQEGEMKTFGFVFYHPKYQEKGLWEKFREKFDEILKDPMFSADGSDLIEEFKAAEFVEFESPSPDNLDILRE